MILHLQGTQALGPVADLDAAKRRAGMDKYLAYLDRAKTMKILFEVVTGRAVNDEDLEPAFTS